jgi:predicted GH43/DUF377 family glycosyl hydrolase
MIRKLFVLICFLILCITVSSAGITEKLKQVVAQKAAGDWQGRQRKVEILVDELICSTGTLSNFPILLTENTLPAEIFTEAQSGGGDLLFYDNGNSDAKNGYQNGGSNPATINTNRLAVEIVKFDTANSKAEIHTSVPTVNCDDQNKDRSIVIYYGATGKSQPARDASYGTEAVWDADFIAVHHFPYHFAEYGSNPILSPAGTEDNTGYGSVWWNGGTDYHMYYSYYDDPANEWIIGHATSTDGLSWTKDSVNNPVLSKGAASAWDEDGVWLPLVWKEGSTWYMLYTGRDSGSNNAIGLATSSDGTSWNKDGGNPAMEGTAATWDVNDVEAGAVIKIGSTYYLWYNKVSATRQVGLATSSNLTSWSKNGNNPIFGSGRFCAGIFKKDSTYYMILNHYVSGSDYSEFELYSDSVGTFLSGNRVSLGTIKTAGHNGVWDDTDQDTPLILTTDITRDTFAPNTDEIWVYYSGDDGTQVQMGLMRAYDVENALKGSLIDSTSNDYTLDRAHNTTPPSAGGPVLTDGKWSGAIDLNGSDALQFGDKSLYNQATVSLWLRPEDASESDKRLFDANFLGLYANNVAGGGNSNTIKGSVHDGTDWTVAEWAYTNISQNTWYKMDFKYDGTTGYLRVNGTERDTDATYDGTIGAANEYHGVGSDRDEANVDGWIGKIAEFRYSDIARSDQWLLAEYNNQNAPGTYVVEQTPTSP